MMVKILSSSYGNFEINCLLSIKIYIVMPDQNCLVKTEYPWKKYVSYSFVLSDHDSACLLIIVSIKNSQ